MQRPCGRPSSEGSRSSKEHGEGGRQGGDAAGAGAGGRVLTALQDKVWSQQQAQWAHWESWSRGGAGCALDSKRIPGCLWRIKRDDVCDVLSTMPGTQEHLQPLVIPIIKRWAWSSQCGSAVMNPTSIHEDAVQPLAPLSVLRIQHCRER